MPHTDIDNLKHSAQEKLVLALDVDDQAFALSVVDELKDLVGLFKVGHQLFTACGPDIVRQIIGKGGRVFLDLKYHDIPHTVAKASAEAVKIGVSMFNVHAMGGIEMMRSAAVSTRETADKINVKVPIILAVTVLTSMDQTSLRREIKITRSLTRTVMHFARLAQQAGLHGVVASPQEIKMLRRGIRGKFIILTPGVRPHWSAKNDQKRVLTPAEAVSAGADYIVIGRPVLQADNRRRAVEMILQELTSKK